MSQSLQVKTPDPSPSASRLQLAGFIAGAAIILFFLSKVLLVIFASILFAIALCSLAKLITAHAKVPHAVAVLIAALAVVAVLGWPFMTYGSRLWAQFDEIAMDIPKAVASIKTFLEAHASVQFLEQIIGDIDLSKIAAPVATQLTSIVALVSTVIAYAILLLFGGVYLALSPDLYVTGLLRFTPLSYRDRVQQFLEQSGSSLRIWLSTQLLVVLINGVFAGIGLWVFGVHDAAALAMLAGLLSFIPYVGTIIAMIIGGLATLPARSRLRTLCAHGPRGHKHRRGIFHHALHSEQDSFASSRSPALRDFHIHHSVRHARDYPGGSADRRSDCSIRHLL